MNQKQAGNALTLADLLKKKRNNWSFWSASTCGVGVSRENYRLFNKQDSSFSTHEVFGARIDSLLYGSDILSDNDNPTQAQVRKAILKVVDEEGWEEA